MGDGRDGDATNEWRCAACGYRSADADFFRLESAGFLSEKSVYCAGCRPRRRSRAERGGQLSFGLTILAGLLWALDTALSPKPIYLTLPGGEKFALYWLQAVLVGAAILSSMMSITLHEFGHAAFAYLTRTPLRSIQIGLGPVIKSYQWKTTKVELRRYLFAGGQVSHPPEVLEAARWRFALVLLGGPLVHGVFAAVALLVHSYADDQWVVAATDGVLVAQVAFFVENLWPSKGSDGRQLFQLLMQGGRVRKERARGGRLVNEGLSMLKAGRYADAVRHYQSALGQHRGDAAPVLFGLLLHALVKGEEARAAIEFYLAHKDSLPAEEEVEPARMAGVHANAAWGAALTGDPTLLPLAQTLSRKALDALPNAPGIRGIRGTVLVEQGDYGQGIALLTEAVRAIEALKDDKVDDDRAEFVGAWSKGERARGNFEMSEELGHYQHYLLERIAEQRASVHT